jgi:ATP phosphoribosyltransferase
MDRQQRLRIAVQKSGRLTDESLDLLHRCGLKFSRGKDQLMCYGENMPLDVLFVRDDDIPDLVQEDVCDLGLVGLNVLEEKRLAMLARGTTPHIEILQKLDFGRCRLSLAVPQEFVFEGLPSIAGQRIATTYPHVLARFLRENAITAEIVTLSGAVEIAPRLGRADLICDLVSTGSTLTANHLREVAVVLESQVCLVRTPVALPEVKADWRASTSCCTRRARPWRRSRSCCPAASPPRSSRWTAPATRSRCTPSVAKPCSGRRSRA